MKDQLIVEMLRYWVCDEGKANDADKDRTARASSGYQEAQIFVNDLLTMDEEALRALLKEEDERVLGIARRMLSGKSTK